MRIRISFGHLCAMLLLGTTIFIIAPVFLFLSSDNWTLRLDLTWPLIATAMIAFGCLVYPSRENRARMLTGTYWVFVLIFYGIAGVLQVGSDTFPHGKFVADDYLFSAGLVVLIGSLGFLTGIFLSEAFGGRVKMVARVLYGRRFARDRTIVAALVLLPVTVLLIMKLGGFGQLLLPRSATFGLLSENFGENGGALPVLARAFVRLPIYGVAVAVTILHLCKEWTQRRRQIFSRIIAGLVWVCVLIINNPINSPRFWVGSILIAAVLLFFYRWGRAAEPLMLAGLVIAFIFIFPYSDSFRRAIDPSATLAHIQNTTAFEELTGKADYDAFVQSAVAADYVDHKDYLYGENLLGAALFPVPRSIWADKPRSSGAIVGAYKDYSNLVVSMPLFSEFYMSGGYPLAFLGMILMGWLLRSLEIFLTNDFNNKKLAWGSGFAFAVYAVYAGQMFLLWRGTLIASITNLVPIFLLMMACTKKVKKQQPAEEETAGAEQDRAAGLARANGRTRYLEQA
jgi:hypothetical protein